MARCCTRCKAQLPPHDRMPFEPLWRQLVLATRDGLWDQENPHGGGLTDELAGMILGVTSRTVLRWRADGWLSVDQADRAAVALDLHPALIWGARWAPPDALFDRLRAELEEVA